MAAVRRLVLASTFFALAAIGCDGGDPREDAGRDAAVADARAPIDATLALDANAPDAAHVEDAASPDGGSSDGGSLAAAELAFVATYLGGISVYTIDPASGALTLVSGSPFDDGAHYYGVAVDPSARFAYAVDVDAGDVVSYRVEPGGALTRLGALHVGGSPQSIAIHPGGDVLYVGVDTPAVLALAIADDGTVSMPDGSSTSLDSAPAYLAIDAEGRFLYASHSAAAGVSGLALDSAGAPSPIAGSPFFTSETIFGGALAIEPNTDVMLNARFALNGFSIDASGALALLDGSPFSNDVGADPTATSVAIDPSGDFAYAVDMASGHVSGYALDASAGTLTAVPGSPFSAASPYSIAIDPSGRFVYVPGDAGSIAGFARDATTGALSPVEGSPFALNGLQPEMVIVAVPDAP